MKKFITISLALIMVFSLGISAFAATSDFVKSIEAKAAPTIVAPKGYEADVVALLLDSSNQVKGTVTRDELLITPFNPKEDNEIQKTLKTAYDEILNEGLVNVLSEEDKKAVENAGVKAENLVVCDFFDMRYVKSNTLSFDNKLNVTFKTDLQLKNNSKVFAMVQVDEKWQKIPDNDIKITEDGNINVSFTKNCPVAFMVEGEPDNTSDNTMMFVWIAIAVIALAAIIVILIFGFKGKKNSHTNF